MSTAWRNWAGTESAVATAVVRPRDVPEICKAVTGAAEAGQSIRARGNGHSFTSVGAAHGIAIELSDWTGVTAVDPAAGLVTVRSGTTIRALNAELDRLGLALTNLGDIDAQTIAGAISTGTHGTGAAFGGLATQVAALELVLADGSVVTCSATERPDLFAAARIGLGALGVITTVTLRTEPAFVLSAQEGPEPLEQVLEALESTYAGNDHVDFYWFPYGDKALIKRNNRLPAGATAQPLGRLRRFYEYQVIENATLDALCRIGRRIPHLGRPLARLASTVPTPRSYSDISHRVFVTARSVRFVESEYAIPRESLADVLNELRARVPALPDPIMLPVEIRVAAADDIWLSTAYRRDSAYIAVHQYVGMPYRPYFDLFESIVATVGGRPHWGKMHTLGAATLRERFPRFDDFTRLRAELDPQGLFENPYTARVLGSVR